MGVIDEVSKHIKQQPGKRYRFIRKELMNVTEKRLRGYKDVRPEDPEVKGTILEKEHTADHKIQVGNLVLARISEADFQKHSAKVHERTDKKLRMIKRDFLEQGEKIQRKMGTSKFFKPIVRTEE